MTALYDDILTNTTLILKRSHSFIPFVSKRLNVPIMYDKGSFKVRMTMITYGWVMQITFFCAEWSYNCVIVHVKLCLE